MLLACSMTIFASCSSDDGGDSSNNTSEGSFFKIDEKEFDMSQSFPSATILIGGLEDLSEPRTASLEFLGRNGDERAIVNFRITYMENEGISGTYLPEENNSQVGVFDTYFSQYVIHNVNDPNLEESSEVTSGTLTITDNGNKNYTIVYDVVYDDGKTSSANFTQTFL